MKKYKKTIEDFDNALVGLGRLAEIEMPLETSLIISKNIASIDAVMQPIREQTNKRARELGEVEQHEDGSQTIHFGKNAEKFNEEKRIVYEKETTIELEPIKVKDLKEYKIEPKYVLSISFLFS